MPSGYQFPVRKMGIMITPASQSCQRTELAHMRECFVPAQREPPVVQRSDIEVPASSVGRPLLHP